MPMDATTWNSRAKSVPVMEMERIVAWSFVVVAHLLLAWLATRISMQRQVVGSPMELVFIQLSPPPSPTKTAVRKQQAVSGSPMTASLKSRRETEMAVLPARDSSPARPLQVTTEYDQWSSASEPAGKYDGIQFNRNKLTTHFNPIRAGAPSRLHLRRGYSPRDVLRIVSSNLFWPPGYTDDPCPGMAKAVEILSSGSTAREHRLLEDAVLQQSTYCN